MSKILGTLIIGLLLTASGSNVSADQLEDGIAAYQRGDLALRCGCSSHLPNKAMRLRSRTSVSCTSRDEASLRIIVKR